MPGPEDHGPGRPDRIHDRADFARELTLSRERAGLTIRQVAQEVGIRGAHTTIGDWFAGRGLPSLSSRDVLVGVLRACGVDEPHLAEWLAAWHRVRRAPGPAPDGPEPYRGLAGFQREDGEWFFGREAVVAEVVDRIRAARGRGGLQVVVGPSGSGKSSLLRAGVIPALDAGEWTAVVLQPGADPLAALAAALPERHDGLVLVVDQFEETFTACPDEEVRRGFVAALRELATTGRAVVVLALRADFYGQALRHPALVDALQHHQLALGPMSEADLRRAIVEPARRARIDLQDGLVELLLREVSPGGDDAAHEPGGLPLLSHALYATWSHGGGKRMTIADYRAVGGIRGAVAASAAAVHDDLTEHERDVARRLFLSLVHIAPDAADTRRRVGMAELRAQDGVAPVLDRFVAQRLVTASRDTVEISHEALLTAWPLLRRWLDADRAGLVVARRLEEAAATWQREDRDDAALYRGTRLAVIREHLDAGGRPVTPLAREFVAASVERERGERRAARRRARRLRRLVAGLVVLLVLAVASTFLAVTALRETREQRDVAVSAKVANEATALRAADPALAGQLGLAAYRLAPTAEARGSLLSATGNTYSTTLTGHTGSVYAAVFGHGGRLLVTAGVDGTVLLWDATDPRRPARVGAITGHDVLGVALAGDTLATGGDDHVIRLWDVADPTAPRPLAELAGHTGAVRRVAFGPDGRTLASAGHDGTVRLWDVADRVALAEVTAHPGGANTAVFSPDGRTLATAGSDAVVRLWDVTRPREPTPLAELAGHTDRVLCAAFSPDGRTLASGGFDNTLRLWDVRDPRRTTGVAALTGHANGVVAVAFDPDGRTVATGSYDLTVRLWDVEDPSFPSEPVTLSGHTETVYAVAFSPDGRTLASAGRDAAVRLWDVRGPVLGGHSGPVHAAVPSPDGRLLVATSYRTARLWDIHDPHRPAPLATLTGHTDNVVAAVFGPDSRTLITAGLDSVIILWDLADPAAPARLTTLTAAADNVFTLALSPDGRTLAAGDEDAVHLWDVSDPRRPGPATTLTGHTDDVLALAFTPDGRTLVSGSADRTVRMWPLADPLRRPTAFTAHANGVEDLVVLGDGRRLATASTDHTAKVWDVADPHHPVLLSAVDGHGNGVGSIAVSPDQRTLATGSHDTTIGLWDITDPTRPAPLGVLRGHTDRVGSVEFTPSGTAVVSGSFDTTARLWDVTTDGATDRVCATHPPIDETGWRRYFGDTAFTPPCR
ncbi:helix-turn-helix domain-containing protein [Actinosynnema sp. NPDC053489]|uniref:nSTAND1 domain-containing NTPase n=1 Tax=Actinosynnema sp. NPDC053489 TaxID=3363916 RepID=UPI0037C8C8EF